MATVCSVCQAVNRDSAKFCKGCAGRLPAFYGAGVMAEAGFGASRPAALGGGAATVAPAAGFRASARAMLEPATRTFGASAVGVALSLVLLFAVFVLWYVAHASGGRRAAPPPPALPAVATATAEATAPVTPSVVAPSVPIEREPLTPAEAVILAEPPAPRAPAARPAYPDYPPAASRELQGQAPMPAPVPVPRAAPADGAPPSANGPLAGCMGLNFFARAICMNNRCAQPANAGHPQCAEVLRQRRLDEARRNPTMIN